MVMLITRSGGIEDTKEVPTEAAAKAEISRIVRELHDTGSNPLFRIDGPGRYCVYTNGEPVPALEFKVTA